MSYKISIIIPIYNAEIYLDKAINSIINQTIGFENLELILIDNGSTDNTKNIINKYDVQYDNIFVIFIKDNTGSAAIPRNMGIKQSTADYIMFLDCDDEFMPDYCEVAYKKITENNVDLVKCNHITITHTDEHYNYYFNKEIKEKKIKNTDLPLNYVAIWNGIHKSEILKKNDILFPNYMCEDIYFSTKEFLNINEMLYLNDFFGYKYYNYETSHAKVPSKEKIIEIINILKKTRDYCKENGREDVMNVILGTQIMGVYSRISKSSESTNTKKQLLKKTCSLVKTMPNLIIPSIIYRIANSLLRRKLINITLLYLKIISKSSKVLLKLK